MRKLYISNSHNPYFNLAFEEHLVKNASVDDEIYYLWQNDQTVVIGRNQNPWKECNIEKLHQDGGRLVRRLSGGGAVFHDLGNLNFTIIRSEQENRVNENVQMIIDMLKPYNIEAHFSGKNDILVNEHKISGNAFIVEDGKLCHHGTLLINADLNRLSDYLRPSELKLQSKGIDSVRARVKNLTDFNGDIQVNHMIYSLVDVFGFYVNDVELVDEDGFAFIKDDILRYESWEWNFGSSPKFDISFSERFDFGEIELGFNINDGIIKDVSINTDINDVIFGLQIKELLKDQFFRKDCIKKAFHKINISRTIKDSDIDLLEKWIDMWDI